MRIPNRASAIGAWVLENGHRTLLKITGGRWPRRILGMQPVELFTIGRVSGRRRSTMLTAPIVEDDRIVLVASKGGHDEHPDWYRNLAANPGIELAIDGDPEPHTARTATAEEKAELWPRIVAAYRGYDGYRRNTDRDIPVIICTPCDPPT